VLRNCSRFTGAAARHKTPALKAHIKEQLISKCGRFLAARATADELGVYWAIMCGDDPAAAQKMLDATTARMRRG
jgi:hypothetical protein